MKYSSSMRCPIRRSTSCLCLEAGEQLNKTLSCNIHEQYDLQSLGEPADFRWKRTESVNETVAEYIWSTCGLRLADHSQNVAESVQNMGTEL